VWAVSAHGREGSRCTGPAGDACVQRATGRQACVPPSGERPQILVLPATEDESNHPGSEFMED